MVVDGFKTIGTMQICISRMFQESAIFFLVSARVLRSLPCPHAFHQLLTILLAGFVQAMYALDAADGSTDSLNAVSSSVTVPWMRNDLLKGGQQPPASTHAVSYVRALVISFLKPP